MKSLWILVIVFSLAMVGCACKTTGTCGPENTASTTEGKSGQMAHDHEGPCTDECKVEMTKDHAMTCNHEGPCTDECKTMHDKDSMPGSETAPEDQSDEKAEEASKG